METYLDNNISSWSGALSAHNADLLLSATGGWDLPNNRANLWFTVNNTGDLSSGPVNITVTYPLSMSLLGDVSGDWRLTDWQDYPDQHYFTATLSNLESQNGTQINYSTQMELGGPISGGEIFTFITDISVPPDDSNPDNNHASFTLASGPDLFVEKTLSSGLLLPGGSVTYHLRVGNRSTATGWSPQGTMLITDTLPANLRYDDTSYGGPRLVKGQTIVFDMGPLYPGVEYGFDIYTTITNTANGGDVLTNTAIIASSSLEDVDINPADNTSSVAIMLLEVTRVDLHVGVSNASVWGTAQPNSTVNVQTADNLYTTQADPSGGWSLIDIGSVQPGATLTVIAGSGILPVTIHVPDPFSVNIDSTLEQVWGQIVGSAGQIVTINGYWPDGYRQLTADPSSYYTTTYSDIPVGASGEVFYSQTIDNAQVTFHHPFHEAYVNLRVEKSSSGAPAPGGNYTYQIAYYNDSGDPASNVILTDTLPAGMRYLGDTSNYSPTVNGNQVVWQLGDLGNINTNFQLLVAVDPGLTPGTLLTNTVQIATPTNEWNYTDNTYQWAVYAVANDTHLNIGLWSSLGDPAPGSQYSYNFNVCNNGSTSSSNVVLTATLPITTTLIDWNGSGWNLQNFVGQELVLSYPSITAWNCAGANLNVLLDANAPLGSQLQVRGVITASNDIESSDNTAIYTHNVGTSRIEQWVNKYLNSGLLVPGSILQFQISYGYDANFNPGIITITDTLPVNTAFVEAWRNGPSGQEFLTPVRSSPGYVVFEFNNLTGNNYGNTIYVSIRVDEAAIPGTQLTNTAQIQPHAMETYLDNNISSWSGTLSAHNADLSVTIGGGWDLPNNTTNLGFTIYNSGDLGSGPVTITSTYPVSMSLTDVIYPDGHNTSWQDYPELHYFTATMDNIASGEWAYFYYVTQMQGGGAIPGGQVFTFETDVSVSPADFIPTNNHASFTLASGPDLFVEKSLSSGTLLPGGSLIYYLHIGDRSTANGWNTQGSVLITDTLPAGLTYNGSNWGPVLVKGQIIVWNVGGMSSGWDSGIYVNATITNTAQIGEIFTNTATIASTSPADVDINSVDNISSHSFTIMSPAYVISKQAEGSLVASTLVTYTLNVTNTGNVTGTNIQIYDPVPSDLTFFNSNGWGWDGFAVYWTIAQLEPQESAQVWFSAYLPATAGITVTNQNYLVTSSDQGIGSPVGAPISFVVLAPQLAAPSDLGATATVCNQIDLSWTDNSTDETKFRLERSPDGSTDWIEIATVNANVEAYSNTGLSSATPYYYRVRAYRDSDLTFSDYSNIANATTQTCTAVLVISPSVSTVAAGQDFDVVLQVQAGTQLVDGAAAYLNFDPTYLQVITTTPGSTLPDVILNDFNNSTGELNFAAGKLSGDKPTGTFTLATVTFHALVVTDSTGIHFYDVDPRKSDITFGGYSILSATQDGTVTIMPSAIIQGRVSLQGRFTPPNASWSVPLRVKLTLPGETTPIYSLTTTTDTSGHFVLGGILPGTYDVYVKNIHTLQNKQTIALVEGTNVVNFGTLKEGDANDNNFVNLNDFSILANTFSKCVGYIGYDGRADFNESGCVTLPDFSLLATNFLQGGQILSLNPESNITAPETPQADVLIVVQPALLNVNVGDTFSVTIQIQSGSQLMNGAQASMDFDPDQLRVNKLTGNST